MGQSEVSGEAAPQRLGRSEIWCSRYQKTLASFSDGRLVLVGRGRTDRPDCEPPICVWCNKCHEDLGLQRECPAPSLHVLLGLASRLAGLCNLASQSSCVLERRYVLRQVLSQYITWNS